MTSPSTVTVGTKGSGGNLNNDTHCHCYDIHAHSFSLSYSYNGVFLGSSTGNSSIIYVIIFGSIGTCTLALFVILTLCVIIGKRQVRKKRVVLNAGR